MSWLFAIFFAVIVVVVLSQLLPKKEHPDAPPLVPLLKFFKATSKDATEGLEKLRQEYGSIFAVNVPLWRKIYFLFGEESSRFYHAAKESDFSEGYKVFMGPLEPFDIYEQPYKGTITPGLAKSLTRERYNQILTVVQESAQHLISSLDSHGKINIFDFIYAHTNRFSMRVFAGREIAEGPNLKRFMELFRQGDPEAATQDVMLMFKAMIPILKNQRQKVYNDMQAMLDPIIDNRVQNKIEENDMLNEYIRVWTNENGEVNHRGVFLMAWSSIMAATLTTFATLAWVIISFIDFPEYREKALKEYEEAVKEKGVTFDAMNSMPFFDRCIKEVTRKNTPGISFRGTNSDVTLPITEKDGSKKTYFLSKGSLMLFSHKLLSNEVFSNPEAYNPDRFLEEGTRPCTYLGFGSGRHPCIGMKFAMQFIKVVVATLFKNFDLVKKNEFEGSTRQLVGLAKPSKPLWVEYTRK